MYTLRYQDVNGTWRFLAAFASLVLAQEYMVDKNLVNPNIAMRIEDHNGMVLGGIEGKKGA